LFGQLSPVSSGLSRGGLRNLKSLIGQAMLASGLTTVAGRSQAPLLPEWRHFLETIGDGYQRSALSRLARYSSERGIKPEEMDDEAIARYSQELVSKSLVEWPKRAVRKCVRVWNRVRTTAAGRHLQEVHVPNGRRKHTLPPATFPLSFREDLDAYLADMKAEDLFTDSERRPASPDTIAANKKQIFAIASALVEAGHDPQSICSIGDLVQPQAAKAALTVVWKRLGRRKTGYLRALAVLIVKLGHYWVEVPPEQLAQLRDLRRSISPKTPITMSENSRRRMLQFGDRANLEALLRLPERLMAEAVHCDRGGTQEALIAQTALAIAILLASALRIRTLVNLNYEEHVLRSRPGPRGVVQLVIPGIYVKYGMPLDFVLPPRVVRLLDLYWERFRPRLGKEPSAWLFPGHHGPKNRIGMSTQISATIYKKIGLRMHTHLFRHLAAFLILNRHPGEYETVRLLLGHRSINTTVAFYCGIEQAAAFARYDDVVSAYLAEEDGGETN
jgi:integrase